MTASGFWNSFHANWRWYWHSPHCRGHRLINKIDICKWSFDYFTIHFSISSNTKNSYRSKFLIGFWYLDCILYYHIQGHVLDAKRAAFAKDMSDISRSRSRRSSNSVLCRPGLRQPSSSASQEETLEGRKSGTWKNSRECCRIISHLACIRRAGQHLSVSVDALFFGRWAF